MSKRSIAILFLTAILVVSVLVSGVYAFHGKDKGKHGKGGWEEKILRKAGFMLKCQEELGLTEAQVKKIKDLKVKVKKDIIKKDAEISLLAVDIKSKLYEDDIDIEAVKGLIDKKYDLKKTKAKSLVGSYITLKGILTEEQKGTLKGFYGKCKPGK